MWSNCLLDLGTDFLIHLISYKYHVTNEEVYAKIQQAIEPHNDLIIIRRSILQWYGHVSHSSGLAKTILQGTVKGGKKKRLREEEVRRQHQGMDRPRVRQVPEGSGEEGKMEETGCEIICGTQTTFTVGGYMVMIRLNALIRSAYHFFFFINAISCRMHYLFDKPLFLV